MSKHIKRIELKKGQVGIIDNPKMGQSFILFQAPEDGGIFYLFPDVQSCKEWLDAKSRGIPVPPEIQARLDNEAIQQASQNMPSVEDKLDSALEEYKKKRLKELEAQEKNKGVAQ